MVVLDGERYHDECDAREDGEQDDQANVRHTWHSTICSLRRVALCPLALARTNAPRQHSKLLRPPQITDRRVGKPVGQRKPIPLRQPVTPPRQRHQHALGNLRMGFHQGVTLGASARLILSVARPLLPIR